MLAASLCGTWVFCRILYTIGYASGDPKKVGVFVLSAPFSYTILTIVDRQRNSFGAAGIGMLASFGKAASPIATHVTYKP